MATLTPVRPKTATPPGLPDDVGPGLALAWHATMARVLDYQTGDAVILPSGRRLPLAEKLAEWYADNHINPEFPVTDRMEAARNVMALSGACLQLAETFSLSEQVTPIIDAASLKLDSWNVQAADFPTPYGFVWFDQPVGGIGGADTQPWQMRGFYWGQAIHGDNTWGVGRMLEHERPHGVILSVVMAPDHPGVLRTAPTKGQIFDMMRLPLPWTCTPFEFGEDVLNLPEMKRTGLEGPNQLNALRAWRFIGACMTFMTQRIVGTSRVSGFSFRQTRLAREGLKHFPAVNVVTLRKIDYPRQAQDGGSQPQEWSCHWLVSGHYRTLNKGTVDARQVWVKAHVKGDRSKPFRSPRRVFDISR